MLRRVNSSKDNSLSADQKAILETDFYRQLIDFGAQLFLTDADHLVPGISANMPRDFGHNFELVATFANHEGWPPISAQESVIATLAWPQGEYAVHGLSVTEAMKTPADYTLWMLVRLALRGLTSEPPEALISADEELSNRVLANEMSDVDPDDFCDQLYEAHKIQ